MAESFLTLLKEIHRDEARGERWFDDIPVGDWLILSVQASPFHGSKETDILEPEKYSMYHVSVCTRQGVIKWGKRGAWKDLSEKPWAEMFRPENSFLMVAEEVPAETVQQIYEDMLEYAEAHPKRASRPARTPEGRAPGKRKKPTAD